MVSYYTWLAVSPVNSWFRIADERKFVLVYDGQARMHGGQRDAHWKIDPKNAVSRKWFSNQLQQ